MAPPKLAVMTRSHPRWKDFVRDLVKGCNLQRQKGPSKCDSTIERPISRRLLKKYRVDVDKSLAYFAKHGGYCDCEVVFNVGRLLVSVRKPGPKKTRQAKAPRRRVKPTKAAPTAKRRSKRAKRARAR